MLKCVIISGSLLLTSPEGALMLPTTQAWSISTKHKETVVRTEQGYFTLKHTVKELLAAIEYCEEK